MDNKQETTATATTATMETTPTPPPTNTSPPCGAKTSSSEKNRMDETREKLN